MHSITAAAIRPSGELRDGPAPQALYAAVLAVVAGIQLAAIVRVEPLLSANDRSRWCTVWSLVERGTYQIDEIDADPAWSTIDKVRHEGHFYSSKPPLLSTLYAGVYWLVKKATGWTLLAQTRETTRAILIITHLIPWLIALGAICRLAERYVDAVPARVLLVMTAAFGTLVTTFTVTINNHSLAAVSATLALSATMRLLEDSASDVAASRRICHSAIAGFFAAFTVTCELPAALFGGLLFLLLLRRDWRLTVFVFVPAALVPLIAYFVTNGLATGGWKPFYAFYGTEKYRYVHEGIPSYWMNPKGLDRAVDSPAVYFLHCTIGHHGILSLTPVWWISLLGWSMWRRPIAARWKPLLLLGAVLNLVVLAFYLSRRENYNYGGNTAGLRWMVWLVPFWLIALIPPLERYSRSRRFRCLYLSLLTVSVFSAHYPLENPWKQPWLFTVMERVGWLKQYAADPPKPFARPLTTWFASIPELRTPDEGPWIELEGVDAEGRRLIWRLQAEPDSGRERAVALTFTRTVAGAEGESFRALIDRTEFEAGADPERFLLEPANVSDRVIAARWLRALPTPRPYREGVERYLRTGLRAEAFACQRAASRVLHALGDSKEVWNRTDLWLCPDVPFGVMRVELTVNDAGNGESLSFQRMTIRDCHPKPWNEKASAEVHVP